MLDVHMRPSPQIRAGDPAGDEDPHPRAVEMADTMLDVAALGHGVVFRDLIGAGFTSAEIIEHHRAAERLATAAGTRNLTIAPDRLAEMIAKACAPVPNAMPLPAGTAETQALFLSWGRYCAARAAYRLDQWSGQRERCLTVLSDFLDRLPILPRDRKAILRRVSEVFQRVVQ